jgi:glyoxylase-like metal-dependent hydrolase (beta-lactamase superfamily II)
MQCLATSTLGGRNDRTINLDKRLARIFGAVHSETVDMLFTVRRVTQAKCPRDDVFRQLVECTENFAPWTAKRSRWQARRVLIDAGIGGGIASSLGQLLDNLAATDITPASIDAVLLTHLHRDHVRGLSTPDGTALFPNAEIMVHEAELAFWTDEKEEARAPAIAKPHFTIARAALKSYARQISTFAKDAEILNGIQAVHAPGHTPGHTLYRIVSGSSSLLIAGDIVHMPALQFARPEWSIVLDVDQVAAAEACRRMLDAAAVDREMIAGMHFHFPAFGHVKRDRQGYQFAPALWQTGL